MGSTATMAASSALKARAGPDETTAARSTDAVGAVRQAVHPAAVPAATRSALIWPNNGLPTIATSAAIPVTSARPFGARSIPTIELTFNAKVTSTGARNSRQVPM